MYTIDIETLPLTTLHAMNTLYSPTHNMENYSFRYNSGQNVQKQRKIYQKQTILPLCANLWLKIQNANIYPRIGTQYSGE